MGTLQSRLGDLLTQQIADFRSLMGKVGVLSDLTTSDKTSTVKAINEVNAKPAGVLDSVVVHKSGDESVAGVKTFTSAPVLPDGALAFSKVSGLQTVLDGLVNLTTAQTITSVKTFTAFPLVPTSTPTSAAQVASKGYVDTKIANLPAGGVAGDTIVPASAMKDFVSGASDAVKIDAIQNNADAVFNAWLTNPYKRVVVEDTGVAWPMGANYDGFTDSRIGSLPFKIKMRARAVPGTQTSKADTGGGVRVATRPPIRLVRRHVGTPVNVSGISAIYVGPLLSANGKSSSLCTSFTVPAGKISSFKAGKLYQLESNDSYAVGQRANGSLNAWKAAMVPLAGILINVASYSTSALNTAMGSPTPAVASLEHRTIVGATSGVSALVQGDPGNGQLTVNSVTGDFTANENLQDSSTNAIVGTFTSAFPIMAGLLDDTYTTTPHLREVPRAEHSFDLTLETSGDVEENIPEWNRPDALQLEGCTDIQFAVNIKSGYYAGVSAKSCWNGQGWISGKNMANHAIEDNNLDDKAYSYVFRSLGATEEMNLDIYAERCRHAWTQNVGATTYGQTSSGTPDTTGVNTNNFWSYGPGGRNQRIRITARAMFAQAGDTHEGARDIWFESPKIIQPAGLGRAVTGVDGIVIRGYNIKITDPWIVGCVNAITDGSMDYDSGGFAWTNGVYGGVLEDVQQYGYNQGTNILAANVGLCKFEIVDTVIRMDTTVANTQFTQAALRLRATTTETRNVRTEGSNYTHVLNSLGSDTTGRHRHIGLICDFTKGAAVSMIRDEGTLAEAKLIGFYPIINPNNGNRPAYCVRNFAGATKWEFRDILFTYLGTNKVAPGKIQLDATSTATMTRLLDIDEVAGSGQGFTNRGAWAASTAYSAYDVLTNAGSTYLVTASHTSPATFTTTNLLLWAAKGDAGTAGTQGVQGIQGVKGDTGTAGTNGTNGSQGIQGVKGDTGTAGTNGTNGSQGIQGVKGDTGTAGTNGTNGTGFVTRGAWTAGTAYAVNDVVTNAGSTYVVTTAHTSDTVFATTNLLLWASKGDAGRNGTNGTFVPTGTDLLASYIRIGATSTMITPATGIFYAYPHVNDISQVVSALVVQVSNPVTPGSAVVSAKLGVWADAGGKPDLAAGPIFSADVDLTSAASKRVIPWSTTLAPGRIWVGFLYLASAAPTTPATMYMINGVAWNLPTGTANSFSTVVAAWKWNGISAFPTSMNGVYAATSNEVPIIAFRTP